MKPRMKLILNRFFMIVFIISVSIGIMVYTKSFDMEYFTCTEYKSIQFNLLTVNSILIGFLFTFLGIFITASESDSLKENRAYIKFGIMVWSIVVSLIAVALSLVINIAVIIINYKLFVAFSGYLILAEISLMLIGVALFLSTTFDSIFLMKMIRKRHRNYTKEQLKGFDKAIKTKRK